MLFFTKNSVKCVTDSGGLQKTYILDTPCVSIRDQNEWVETLIGNHNILSKSLQDNIIDKVFNTVINNNENQNCYGNGYATEK